MTNKHQERPGELVIPFELDELVIDFREDDAQ
jgi:hypothetical protein